jgi:hypothetical protein
LKILCIEPSDHLRTGDSVLHEAEPCLALADRPLCLRQVVVVLHPRRAIDAVMRDVESLQHQARLQQMHRLARFAEPEGWVIELRALDALIVTPGGP